MAEEFIKENNHTISVVQKQSNEKSGVERTVSLTRSFNFLSAQVTVYREHSLFEGRGSNAGGSAAVSTQMIIQNFSDIQSSAEIKIMHKKLIEMGGTPPDLSDVLPILNKKPVLRQKD